MLVDAATMLQNFASEVPQLMRLATALAYVLGMYFIIHGIKLLKNVGSNANNGETPLMHCLTFIAVGSALIYLPSTIQSLTNTFWQSSTPYSYLNYSSQQFSEIVICAVTIIQLIGVIAIIRGLIILTYHSKASAENPSSFQKGIVHLIAGALCTNIILFSDTIFTTLGIQF
jgi:uncharacterized membrane protein HdeD (DUF308 family)